MLTILSFLFAGALSGLVIAYSMDMKTPQELLQGAAGGLIAGFLMAMMLPR